MKEEEEKEKGKKLIFEENNVVVTIYKSFMKIKFIKNEMKHSIDIWTCSSNVAENMKYALYGSKYFLIAMAQIYKQHGLKISRYGIVEEGKDPRPVKNEKEIFDQIGLESLDVRYR